MYNIKLNKKIKYIFENLLHNVKEDKKESVIKTLNECDIKPSIEYNKLRAIIYNILDIKKSVNRYGKEYWLKRGWTEQEIKELKLIPKRLQAVTPMTQEYWLKRGFTEEESRLKIKEQRKCNKEYWLKRGFTEEESRLNIIAHQKYVSNKLLYKYKINPEFKKQLYDKHSYRIEYWLNKGYSEEEAKKKLSDRQTTFSLEKCIKKYGEIEGHKRWQDRQEKWYKNFTKQNYSNISQNLFWEIYNRLNKEDVYFATNDCGVKTEGKNLEYKIKTNKTVRSLDFYIPSLKKCIEFDGDYWHGEKRGNKERDMLREKEIKESIKNIEILHIKERDYKKEPEKILNECLEFIYE